MILVGSQRGGAGGLATHLMNVRDNDHVTLYDVQGFMADDLHGALAEAHAISKGTRCKQFLFSLSLNPPKNADVSITDLVKAAERAGEALGLQGQPRAIVIHEKEARRHAHVVWSRIDAESMKAINLPYFKSKLATVSKELYLEHGWELPDGHKTNGWKNPLNFTLAEWQQAKRLDLDPREIKQIFRDAWMRSDGLKAFSNALAEHGYSLARGDRRGFVAVDIHGEVYSVARWSCVKTKDVRLKFGQPENLPSVTQAKQKTRQRISERLRGFFESSRQQQQSELSPLNQERAWLVDVHRQDRINLEVKLMDRWSAETATRCERLRKGLAGLWDKITGKAKAIRALNIQEAQFSARRDLKQRQEIFLIQMKRRRELQARFDAIRDRHRQERITLNKHVFNILQRGEAVRQRSRTHNLTFDK